jgi:hypothetical protein
MKKIIQITFILLLLSLLNGCIFFRLSRVLVQLKTPENYINVDLKKEKFNGVILQKIIYLKDIETILGRKSSKHKDGYYFLKFIKKVHNDRTPWFIKMWTDKKGLINQFELPQKLTEVLGNKIIYNAFKAIGYAEVSIGKKRIYLKMNDKIFISQIDKLLGKPASQKNNSFIYHFYSGETLFKVSVNHKNEILTNALISTNGYSVSLNIKQ